MDILPGIRQSHLVTTSIRACCTILQLQVVSCNSDGLRYAFILDRGQLGKLPTHIDYPFIDNGKLSVRVVYDHAPEPVRVSPEDAAAVDERTFVRQVASAFLKVFDDIKLRDEATLQLSLF